MSGPPENSASPDVDRGEESASDRSSADLGRILALSDGIFGFALTLLVLSLVPITVTSGQLHLSGSSASCGALTNCLYSERSAFFGYVIAFWVIGTWWVAHHVTFTMIRRYDPVLVYLNLLFLMLIAITPFLLGLLTNPSFGPSQSQQAVAVYCLFQAAAGAVLFGMFRYASDGRRLVDVHETDDEIRSLGRGRLMTPFAFLAVAGVALLSGELAQYGLIVLLVVFTLFRRAVTLGLRSRRWQRAPRRVGPKAPRAPPPPPPS